MLFFFHWLSLRGWREKECGSWGTEAGPCGEDSKHGSQHSASVIGWTCAFSLCTDVRVLAKCTDLKDKP